MAKQQVKKSAFLATFDGHDEAVKQASQVVRESYTTDEEIIQVYDLKPDERRVVLCRLSAASPRLHDEKSKDKEGLPYVIFKYRVVDGEGKGMSLSRFLPCYDRESLEIDSSALEDIWREIQGFGVDTKGMVASDLERVLTELTNEKPFVMVSLYCSKVKSGPNRGKLRINIQAQRRAEEPDAEASSAPPEAPVMTTKAKKPTKAPVVQEDDDDDQDEDQDQDDAPSFKKGDKVSLIIEDEDGEETEEEGTILSVNVDEETATVKVGKETYEDIAWEDLELV